MKKRSNELNPARKIAYDCLEQTRKRDGYARDILGPMLEKCNIDARDKSFATKLVLGVVATKGTLDSILNNCMRSPSDIENDVRTALEISVYEMAFLNKPTHAVVDQGVELVREICPKASGVANAVLRKVSRLLKDFPFGDEREDIRVAATKFGFPLWMAKRLEELHGFDVAYNFMNFSGEDAPVFIAVNSINASDDEVISAFSQIGASLIPVEIFGKTLLGCFWLDSPEKLHSSKIKRLFTKGKILISDAASQLIVDTVCNALLNEGDMHISERQINSQKFSALELCAGRATKTILLQSCMHRKSGHEFSPFVAVDNVQYKTDISRKRTNDYGVNVDLFVCEDITSSSFKKKISSFAKSFKMVFLDAPCTGTGTLRRHPEIRWKISPDDIIQSARRNLNLICESSSFVEKNGILVYSTCSFEPEENELVIKQFLREDAGKNFEIITQLRTTTFNASDIENHPNSQPLADSHFCALLRRKN